MKNPTIADIEEMSYKELLAHCRSFELSRKGKASSLRKRLIEYIETKTTKWIDDDSDARSNGRNHFDRARILVRLNKPAEALEILDAIKSNDKSYWLVRGSCYFRLGRPKEARECYDKALSVDKGSKEALIASQHLAMTMEEHVEAMRINGLLDPKEIRNLTARVMLLANSGKHLEAIRACDSILQKHELEQILNLKGLLLMKFGKFEEAHELFDRALSLNKDYPEAWNNQGVCRYKLRQYEKADESFNIAVTLRKDYGTAWGNRGLLAVKLGKQRNAINCFKMALQNLPKSETWNNLGLVYLKRNRLKEASQCFERALKLDRTFAEAWKNKGHVFHKRGMLSAARRCYKRARTLQPNLEIGEMIEVKVGAK
jgi:tetratricopeptide (TPR) repeat protein